jgi:hypothetical protein
MKVAEAFVGRPAGIARFRPQNYMCCNELFLIRAYFGVVSIARKSKVARQKCKAVSTKQTRNRMKYIFSSSSSACVSSMPACLWSSKVKLFPTKKGGEAPKEGPAAEEVRQVQLGLVGGWVANPLLKKTVHHKPALTLPTLFVDLSTHLTLTLGLDCGSFASKVSICIGSY